MENNDNKNKLIKIGIYLGIFLIAIIIIIFDKKTPSLKQTQTPKNNPAIIEKIKEINDNYYTSKIHLILDDDAISLEYEKSANLEMGIKNYHKQKTEYIKKENDYYTFNNGEFTKLNNFKEFDYDRTFSEIKNIKKLLEINDSYTSYTSQNLNVLKKEINTKEALKIYNEHNNTDLIKYDEGVIYLEIYYKGETINHIKLNITDLYNFLNDESQEKVEYILTFENKKEDDNSWLLEKLP